MRQVFYIVPIVAALALSGCSSGGSLGDFLTGGKKKSTAITTEYNDGGSIKKYEYVNITETSSSNSGNGGLRTPPRNSQRVYVVVNDKPITGYDISQRMRLNKVLKQRAGTRKATLERLINEQVQISEVERSKVNISDLQVDRAIANLTKNLNTTPKKLKLQLKKQGIAYSALRRRFKAGMALQYLMQKAGKKVGKVTEAEIDARYKKLKNDPRLRAITVYMLKQVDLPVEDNGAMAPQLLRARAIESQQIARKYTGCSSLKRASAGLYNVQISRLVQADGRKLPPQMKSALLKAGRKKLIGPIRNKRGIQMIAFCGIRKITPPKLTREMVRRMLMSERYSSASASVLTDLRKKAYIDYKVASYRPRK